MAWSAMSNQELHDVPVAGPEMDFTKMRYELLISPGGAHRGPADGTYTGRGKRSVKAALSLLLCGCLSLSAFAAVASDSKVAPKHARMDDRYKADILLVLAHCDDDSTIAGYLARATFDEHRRIAAVFVTDTLTSTASNRTGSVVGRALGAERQIEARDALAFLGVRNIWFLGAPNWKENVLLALEAMDHGSVLGQVVRLIRLTRPQVIITSLPLPVAGENHAGHQAAGVIATEAFDLAADGSAFPEQLADAENDDEAGRGINTYYWNSTGALGYDGEGLQLWQPEKIYYFSDSIDALPDFWSKLVGKPLPPSPFRKNFLDGTGPKYSNADWSPTKRITYARLAAEESSFYLTQAGWVGKEALARRDFGAFEDPTRFVLGKSLVGGDVTGDVFQNITPGPIPFVPPPRLVRDGRSSLELGGPWGFYREFWKAHALERLADLLPIPEIMVARGATSEISLIIGNDSHVGETISLRSVLPYGWVEQRPYSKYTLPQHGSYAAHRMFTVPAAMKAGWYTISWKAEEKGHQVGAVWVHVYVY